MYGDIINAYIILAGKPEGERLHGKARHECEENIKWFLRKSSAGCGLA
jgi:hypothetical protein